MGVLDLLSEWQPVIYTVLTCGGLGVAFRRLELAKMEKISKEDRIKEEKLTDFKKSVYSSLAALEVATSSNRQDIALIDDYSKKVRHRVIALDILTTECIKTSHEAIGYVKGKDKPY